VLTAEVDSVADGGLLSCDVYEDCQCLCWSTVLPTVGCCRVMCMKTASVCVGRQCC